MLATHIPASYWENADDAEIVTALVLLEEQNEGR